MLPGNLVYIFTCFTLITGKEQFRLSCLMTFSSLLACNAWSNHKNWNIRSEKQTKASTVYNVEIHSTQLETLSLFRTATVTNYLWYSVRHNMDKRDTYWLLGESKEVHSGNKDVFWWHRKCKRSCRHRCIHFVYKQIIPWTMCCTAVLPLQSDRPVFCPVWFIFQFQFIWHDVSHRRSSCRRYSTTHTQCT